MMYFVNNLSTYSAKNKACKELLNFIQQFEHVLISGESTFDALSCSIEKKIDELNSAHPKLRPIRFNRESSIERVSASIISISGLPDYVFIMDICRVRNTLFFSEDTLQFKEVITSGVCRNCGCTENDPCFHPDFGTCWWADKEHTLCSHCADPEIKDDSQTAHCINSKRDFKAP